MPENAIPKENKMGTMPIPKLIFNMSLPLIVSMLIQALYNIVDSIFVARLCEDALTAVSLAFPIHNLMIAFATGTGVGINALLSRRLGQKNREAAEQVANTGLLLAILTSLVFAVLGGLFSHTFFAMQKGISDTIIRYGTDYMSIITVFSVGIFVEITSERILQGTGRTMVTMYIQVTGAVINIILDPILIFGLFGAPRLEVRGAAIATVIGQIIAAILGLVLNYLRNPDIRLRLRQIFRPRLSLIREIYSIGFPSILMSAIGSVTNFLMNQILLTFSSTAAAVFGTFFKLNSFAFMPLFGLNNGIVPIVAYNYGAQNRARILQTVKLGMIFGTCIMAVGWALFEFIPGPLLSLFDASETMLAIGIPAFRTVGWTFLLAAFSIVGGSIFQALGKSVYSLLVSLGRQIVVLVPVAYLFSLTGNINLVWYAFLVAEVVCVALSATFLRRVLHLLDGFDR